MCCLLPLLTPILASLCMGYLLCQLGGPISCVAVFYVMTSFGAVGTCAGVTAAQVLLQYNGDVELFPVAVQSLKF